MNIADGPTWLSPAGLSAELRAGGAKTHPRTVQKDCSSGVLHSHQRRRNGSRFINRDVVPVWLRGGSEQEQKKACGCEPAEVRQIRRIA